MLGGGSVEALDSWQIRSEVRGEPVKILKLVDEGTLVTEDDVRTNRVLVELDASKIQQALLNQDISFQTTLAGLTEAQQGFEIQLNQGRVDMRTGEQDAKFAFMDLEKLLGREITSEMVRKLDLIDRPDTNLLAAAESGQLEPDSEPAESVGTTNAPVRISTPSRPRTTVDFTAYAKVDLLGDGSAKQELRKREDELLVAKTALGQAQTKLAGTRRLFEKGFVTKIELENDQIAADQARLKVESAQTTLDLYLRYEFTKSAEETLSKFEKALRSLERVRKEAVSKLAQAAAKMKSAERRYRIEKENRNDLATRVGLSHRLHHRPSELSGGQQQRVAIARALANDPLVLLADEATGNLDSASGREILALFDELNAQGKTLIMVTHDLSVGERASRLIRLRDGQLESDTRR